MGEHLPCKQGVMGSNPIISIHGGKKPKATSKPNSTVEGSQAITAEEKTSMEAGPTRGLIAQVVRARA